ncbi:MAG TPA: hypothetical protein VD707_01070 [Gemmatimonadales bacterium]|nr:hypothetical protein [Gemmatimonadales bacterium]
MRTPSRALTTIAVGVLVLDAALLAIAGVALDRWSLLVGGAACSVLALLVALGWRRYRRTLTEIESARREMRRDVESIRELLHRHHLNN